MTARNRARFPSQAVCRRMPEDCDELFDIEYGVAAIGIDDDRRNAHFAGQRTPQAQHAMIKEVASVLALEDLSDVEVNAGQCHSYGDGR